MKKLLILFLFTFFLYQEKTASPAVKMQPKREDAIQTTSYHPEVVEKRSGSIKLDIPVIRQLPELYNGCEVTSLAMLLHASGSSVTKLQLAEQIKKDSTPFQGTSIKNISQWGNPNEGFVGDIKGKERGYGVYNGPVFELLKEYVGDRAVNLTGQAFSALEWVLDQGNPIVVWTTVSFQPTNQWVTWQKGNQVIKATFQEHAVLLVGYDEKFVYLNDPLTGKKAYQVDKQNFIKSWEQLGKQAVSAVEKEKRYVFETE